LEGKKWEGKFIEYEKDMITVKNEGNIKDSVKIKSL